MTVAQIQSILPAQISSLITLKNNVTVFRIEYKSLNKDEDTVIASGIIILPEVDSFSLPLSSYQHGTVLKKNGRTLHWRRS